MAVISDEGNLSLFKFPLTNHVTAPVSAHSTVQFVSTTQKVCLPLACNKRIQIVAKSSSLPPSLPPCLPQGDTPSPLPVLAAKLSPAGVSLAHTSSLRPCFETIVSSDVTMTI